METLRGNTVTQFNVKVFASGSGITLSELMALLERQMIFFSKPPQHDAAG